MKDLFNLSDFDIKVVKKDDKFVAVCSAFPLLVGIGEDEESAINDLGKVMSDHLGDLVKDILGDVAKNTKKTAKATPEDEMKQFEENVKGKKNSGFFSTHLSEKIPGLETILKEKKKLPKSRGLLLSMMGQRSPIMPSASYGLDKRYDDLSDLGLPLYEEELLQPDVAGIRTQEGMLLGIPLSFN